MTTALWIDLIALAVGLVFFLLGLARGVLPEIFSLLGIMFGIVFVGQWGAAWSADTQDILKTNAPSAQLYTFYGIFLLCFLLVGYIAPLALVRHSAPLTSIQRLMGGLLGLLNGSLVVTWLLTYLFSISADGASAINNSTVGSFLVNKWINWSLLAIFGMVILLILIGAASRSLRILTGPEAQELVKTTTVTQRPPISPYLIPPQQTSYPPNSAATRANTIPPSYPQQAAYQPPAPAYQPPQPAYQPPQPMPPYQPAPPPGYSASSYPQPPSRYATPPSGVTSGSGRLPGYVPPAPPAYEPPRPIPTAPPAYEAPRPVAPAYNPAPERFAPPPSAPEQATNFDITPPPAPPRSGVADDAAALLERRNQPPIPVGPEQATRVDMPTPLSGESRVVEQVSSTPDERRETRTIDSVGATPAGEPVRIEQHETIVEQPEQSTRYEISEAETRVMPPPEQQSLFALPSALGILNRNYVDRLMAAGNCLRANGVRPYPTAILIWR